MLFFLAINKKFTELYFSKKKERYQIAAVANIRFRKILVSLIQQLKKEDRKEGREGRPLFFPEI